MCPIELITEVIVSNSAISLDGSYAISESQMSVIARQIADKIAVNNVVGYEDSGAIDIVNETEATDLAIIDSKEFEKWLGNSYTYNQFTGYYMNNQGHYFQLDDLRKQFYIKA